MTRLLRLATTAALMLGCANAAWADTTPRVCGKDVRALTIGQLRTHCAVGRAGECEIRDSGVVPGGKADGFWYQLSMVGDDNETAAVVFATKPNGRLRPLMCAIVEAGYYERKTRPRIIQSRLYGRLLVFPPLEVGTAGFQATLLFQQRDGDWRPVDLDRWQTVFQRRIAPKYNGWRGVYYDFSTMTAESFLYAPGDAHASPSGFASMRFVIEDGALKLTKLKVGSAEPVYKAACLANPRCHWG